MFSLFRKNSFFFKYILGSFCTVNLNKNDTRRSVKNLYVGKRDHFKSDFIFYFYKQRFVDKQAGKDTKFKKKRKDKLFPDRIFEGIIKSQIYELLKNLFFFKLFFLPYR